MIITTKAIVISSIKYAEADLIISCYTQQVGLKSYILRGILKSKKGKLKPSYFLPLTQFEMVAYHKDKGALERIKEVKITKPYKELHTNVIKGTIVLFLSEVIKSAIQEEEANKALFQFLEQSLFWLDGSINYANFHLLFLLELTTYLGFYPDTSNINADYFNIQEGNFQNSDAGFYCEKGDTINNFKALFGINFDTLSQIKLTKKQRSEVLNLILVYYQLHLQGFKKPRSLEVLNQIFSN